MTAKRTSGRSSQPVTLSPTEAAAELGISARTLLSLARAGKVARVVFGAEGRGRRIIRFRPADLEAYAAEHTVPADRGRQQ